MEKFEGFAYRSGFIRWFVCRFLLTAFVFTISSQSGALDVKRLYAEHKTAVVKIKVTGKKYDGSDAPEREGSGFIARSDGEFTVILTASHVLGERGFWKVIPPGRLDRKIRVFALDERDVMKELSPDAVVLNRSRGDSDDWDILLINGKGHPVFQLNRSVSVEPGSEVLLLGYPYGGHRPAFVDGKAQATDVIRDEGYWLRLSMTVNDGQSGGPILNERGQVIGIASANRRDERGIHLATPIAAVNNYMLPISTSASVADAIKAVAKIDKVNLNPPSDTQNVLRKVIAGVGRGAPDFGSMEPALAAAVRPQLGVAQITINSYGDLKGLNRVGSKYGMEIYRAEFSRGDMNWMIGFAPSGRIASLYFQPAQRAESSETILRAVIDQLRRGQPDYDKMGPELGEAVRQQLPVVRLTLAQLGSIRNVVSVGSANGLDTYKVDFTSGSLTWTIGVTPSGQIHTLMYRE